MGKKLPRWVTVAVQRDLICIFEVWVQGVVQGPQKFLLAGQKYRQFPSGILG
jgi:hypothetical protein